VIQEMTTPSWSIEKGLAVLRYPFPAPWLEPVRYSLEELQQAYDFTVLHPAQYATSEDWMAQVVKFSTGLKMLKEHLGKT